MKSLKAKHHQVLWKQWSGLSTWNREWHSRASRRWVKPFFNPLDVLRFAVIPKHAIKMTLTNPKCSRSLCSNCMKTILSFASVFRVLRETKLASVKCNWAVKEWPLSAHVFLWEGFVAVACSGVRGPVFFINPKHGPLQLWIHYSDRSEGEGTDKNTTARSELHHNHCNFIHHISMMKMTQQQHFIKSVLMGNIVFKALKMIDVPVSNAVDSDFMHSRGHNWP